MQILGKVSRQGDCALACKTRTTTTSTTTKKPSLNCNSYLLIQCGLQSCVTWRFLSQALLLKLKEHFTPRQGNVSFCNTGSYFCRGHKNSLYLLKETGHTGIPQAYHTRCRISPGCEMHGDSRSSCARSPATNLRGPRDQRATSGTGGLPAPCRPLSGRWQKAEAGQQRAEKAPRPRAAQGLCSTEQRLGGERGRPQPPGGSAATPSPRPFVLRPSPALPPGCPPARRPPSRRLPPLPSLSAQPCPAPRCLPPPGRTEGRTGCPAPARSLPPPRCQHGKRKWTLPPSAGRAPTTRARGGRPLSGAAAPRG